SGRRSCAVSGLSLNRQYNHIVITIRGDGSMRKAIFGTLAFAMIFAVGAVCAQQYPAKPVRILVGYVPGGGVDTTARIMAAALTDAWGSQVIVENRPGVAGNIETACAGTALRVHC